MVYEDELLPDFVEAKKRLEEFLNKRYARYRELFDGTCAGTDIIHCGYRDFCYRDIELADIPRSLGDYVFLDVFVKSEYVDTFTIPKRYLGIDGEDSMAEDAAKLGIVPV